MIMIKVIRQCAIFTIIFKAMVMVISIMMMIKVIRQCDEHVSAGDRCQTPIDGRFLPPEPSCLLVLFIIDIDFLALLGSRKNKLAKLRLCVHRVHFGQIYFGKFDILKLLVIAFRKYIMYRGLHT